jgi:co-chaperonin GroES (HSP10)
MINLTQEMIDNANDLVSDGKYEAVGYRLIVKPIKGTTGMEAAEKSEFSTLAERGMVMKSDDQLGKEDFGRQYGIVVSIGDGAFKTEILGGKNWVEEGDVVYFDRYAGVHVELPPGSKDFYRIMSDESLIGRIK